MRNRYLVVCLLLGAGVCVLLVLVGNPLGKVRRNSYIGIC